MSKIINPIVELISVITNLNSSQIATEFLEDLLTPEELKEFANRWQVAKLLDHGVQYTKISELTGMSSATIARVSKCLKRDNSGYQRVLNQNKNSNQ